MLGRYRSWHGDSVASGHRAEGSEARGHRVEGSVASGHRVEGSVASDHRVEGSVASGHRVEGSALPTGPSTRSVQALAKRPSGSSRARTVWKRSHAG